MAQQLSPHSKSIRYHLVWFGVFFFIFGSVQSCEVWKYFNKFDRGESTISRHFMADLKSEIDTVDNQNGIKIIEMLVSQNKSQLARILDCYNDCYKRDLIADLKNKFTGKLEEIVVGLLTPELQYSVKLIHDAMVGVDTDSCALIDILVTQNKRELNKIQAEYQKTYRVRLTQDLDQLNVGNFKKLLIALIKWPRNENTEVNQKLAKIDAQKLNSGRDIFSTDRSLMENILVSGSFSRIRQAVYRYHNEYKEYYESKIGQKYTGDVKRALFTIVRWSKGKESFYAERLHSSLNFVDTDDHSLNRIILSNYEDMMPIRKAYRKRYHVSLEEAIRDKLSGPYADALICLITKGKGISESIEEKTEEETEEETKEKTKAVSSEENGSSEVVGRGNWCLWC